ncbi:MAG: hypothetical protein GC159_03875 [Phycisphaera sp.]|nr:hypothetical protein [Phycisphaera sp.]
MLTSSGNQTATTRGAMGRRSKSERQAEIQAELARREAASDVPPALHVYLLNLHHADEGGPRTFFPIQLTEQLDRSRHDPSLYDPDLKYRLVQDALDHGEPIACALNKTECFVPDAPVADYSEIGMLDSDLMLFTVRAEDALRPFLQSCCRKVPVECKEHALVGYQLESVDDVLDTEQTVASWIDHKTRTRASHISRYAFHTDRLGASAIFRLPQDSRSLVLQPFVDVVRSTGLIGMRFRKVWPHPALETWV